MSVSYTVDVWCDHSDCETWTHALVARANRSLDRDARAEARDRGWTRRRVDGEMVDLCPAHSTYSAAERAQLDALEADRRENSVSVFDLARASGDPQDTSHG